jgi:hypothetical protein
MACRVSALDAVAGGACERVSVLRVPRARQAPHRYFDAFLYLPREPSRLHTPDTPSFNMLTNASRVGANDVYARVVATTVHVL